MSRKLDLPAILVLREKHGDHHFYVEDEDTLYTIALEVLTKRQKTGFYYNPSYDRPKELDFTEEQVAAMPAGSMQKEARAKLQKYKTDLRLFENDQKHLGFIAKTIKDKDGKNAWLILTDVRGDYEYEGIALDRALKSGEYRA